MMANEDEYWAEGCQSWFDATIRTDVNDGVNTREKLKAHDPGLAAALKEAFGDGDWRYPDDSPAAFRHRQPSTRSKEAATAAACASPSTSSVVVSGTGFSSSSSAPSRAPQQPKRWPPGYSAATFRDMEASNGYVEATAAAAAAVQTEAPQLEPMDRARLVADNSAVSAMLPPMLAPCITTAGTRACAIGVVTFMRDVYTAVNRESLRSMIR